MMIEVEPGKSRDFDICENCRLSPERGYSYLLEVEEPEGLFVSERRDCLVAEDDPKVVIWDESGATYGQEKSSEKGSVDSRPPSGSAKVALTSSSSRSIGTSQEAEDSSEDLESDEGQSYDSGSDDQEKLEESAFDNETSDSGSIVEDFEEPETEGGTDYEDYHLGEDCYVGSVTSDKYHRPDCSYAKKIKPENRINFSDIWEAREAGYSPCKVCNPQ